MPDGQVNGPPHLLRPAVCLAAGCCVLLYLPACLPACCLLASLPACLPASVPACLPASLPACLPRCLPARMLCGCLGTHTCSCLPTCRLPLSAYMPACLLAACLPACTCLPACRLPLSACCVPTLLCCRCWQLVLLDNHSCPILAPTYLEAATCWVSQRTLRSHRITCQCFRLPFVAWMHQPTRQHRHACTSLACIHHSYIPAAAALCMHVQSSTVHLSAQVRSISWPD